MPQSVLEINPVSHLTVDAIGQPGQRVFYLQAHGDARVITILIEKLQIQTLATGIDQYLAEISNQQPLISPLHKRYDEGMMHIHPPVDPLFRAGDIGLAYDPESDEICLVVKEILTGEMQEEDAQELRLWATRQQMASLSAWAVELTGRGRAICPQCNEPMDPAGHLCPKKNGHKH